MVLGDTFSMHKSQHMVMRRKGQFCNERYLFALCIGYIDNTDLAPPGK